MQSVMLKRLAMATCLKCLVIFYQLFIAVASSDTNNNDTLEVEDTDEMNLRWANSAFDFIKTLNCSDVFFTTQRQCNHLQNLRKRDIAVYIAHPSKAGEKIVAELPDGGLNRVGSHDGMVVLDPYPDANFGHFIIAFFVDRMSSDMQCARHIGISIGRRECMKLALKHRCKNSIDRHRNRDVRNITSRLLRKMTRRCEMNFLPYVHADSEIYEDLPVNDGISVGYKQLLQCREELTEYGLCPHTRPRNETLELVCNPIRDNTRRCETSHDAIGTQCRMFESCDQAVILSGGWNRLTSQQRHRENVISFYHMLRRNGFQQDGIKIFFANGMHGGIQDESGRSSVETEVFPAAMKVALRFHTRRLCATPHCVDTLVFYLNSPTKQDGTMLLWDVNNNGKAENEEQYSIDELLVDLQNCKARTVQIIADQSYSGELTKALKRSRNHGNVVAFVSSKDYEYSYGTTFTDHWSNVDHSYTCTQDVFQQVKSLMVLSNPEMSTRVESGFGPGAVTLFGAPCNVLPPFSQNELRLWYRGCQNVPTEVWLRTFFSNSPSSVGVPQNSINNQANRYTSQEVDATNWSGDVGSDTSEEIMQPAG